MRKIIAGLVMAAAMTGIMGSAASQTEPSTTTTVPSTTTVPCNDYPAGSCSGPVVPPTSNTVVRPPVAVVAPPAFTG